MRYLGHLIIKGDMPGMGRPGVLVYAAIGENEQWVNLDPALLEGAPKEFNAVADTPKAPPRFYRDLFWLMQGDVMRLEVEYVGGRKMLIVHAYPPRNPNLPIEVGVAKLGGMVQSIAFQTGFSRYGVALRDRAVDPLPESILPCYDPLPPANVPLLVKQATGEQQLKLLAKD